MGGGAGVKWVGLLAVLVLAGGWGFGEGAACGETQESCSTTVAKF